MGRAERRGWRQRGVQPEKQVLRHKCADLRVLRKASHSLLFSLVRTQSTQTTRDEAHEEPYAGSTRECEEAPMVISDGAHPGSIQRRSQEGSLCTTDDVAWRAAIDGVTRARVTLARWGRDANAPRYAYDGMATMSGYDDDARRRAA